MAVEVILPKVDMDMATGKISKWFFKEGDPVKKGDVLFEIETDKAAMEIDAPASGVLRGVTGSEGVDIAVGSAVAWIYEDGEAVQEEARQKPADAPAAPAPVEARYTEATTEIRLPAVAQPGAQDGAKKRATPLARRLARIGGISLDRVPGSGPGGRVVRADVEAFKNHEASVAPKEEASPAAAPIQASAPVTADVPAPASTDQSFLKLFPEGSFERVEHTSMRRTIARRLVEAKTTIPHFYLTADCRIDALLKLRAEINATAPGSDGKPDYKISVNDMVIKAYALALQKIPDANVSWADDALIRHHSADIGVAVSIPGGLITPIVRQANLKSLSAISNEMKDLAGRAKDGKLKPAEYQGGTGAVSNLGMFGVREFAAIVNPPHATILAVGAGEKRAVIGQDDAVFAATVMTVTLSTDHRAVDGALAAEVISVFRNLIKRPMSLLV